MQCACEDVLKVLRECSPKFSPVPQIRVKLVLKHLSTATNDSLSALAVFCPGTSRDAICIGPNFCPFPVDFSWLFDFVSQLFVGVGLLLTLITFFSTCL